ncbi:MAG: carbonic anhydrase [Alphaproteobacteria bacterium]|nr:carbonic anhydrase [Alphaproteobacteria bacterium]
MPYSDDTPLKNLIEGYKSFQQDYFKSDSTLYEDLLREGQAPKWTVVACSDSRTDPAMLTNSKPGDMFVIRNVAAIVPPYTCDLGHHGTSAAIEFSVRTLKTPNLVVMGHSHCGGCQALMDLKAAEEEYEFLTPWVSIGQPALKAVDEALPDASLELRHRALEQAVILTSMKNLMTFPWIAEKVKAGTLTLHGWYFDMKNGVVMSYNRDAGQFEPLENIGA